MKRSLLIKSILEVPWVHCNGLYEMNTCSYGSFIKVATFMRAFFNLIFVNIRKASVATKKIKGYLRSFMKLYEYLRSFTNIYEALRVFTKLYEALRSFTNISHLNCYEICSRVNFSDFFFDFFSYAGLSKRFKSTSSRTLASASCWRPQAHAL